jgi:hypothetical protein
VQDGRRFVVENIQVPSYILFVIPTALPGLAAVIAVCRANRDDLPTIIRALMRLGPSEDDGPKGPPSLPVDNR